MGRGDDLTINLLGELRLLARGQHLPLPPSKKTRALLAYLVATGRPHPRERLCDLLWDGPDDPRAALRWSLAKLRPVVDGESVTRLMADRERVAFVLHGATVDIFGLPAWSGGGIASATTTELEAATSLFAGEFLEGLDLPSCFRFHEWCVAEREKWSSLRVTILTALVDRLRDTPEAALPHARARVGIDPLDEDGHLAVIRLLAALDRQREAVRQYEYCRQILAAELGARPGVELERVVASLRGLDRGVIKEPPRQSRHPPPSAEAALVGRDEERALLDTIVADATRTEARPELLLLTGEPGIGKTRLLRHLAHATAKSGGQTFLARAYEAEMRRPYGIWADILRVIPGDRMPARTRAELRPLMVDAADSPATAEGDRVRLYAAVSSLLTELSRGVVVSILIDDLQWIDEASATLLHYVLRGLDARCSVVIAATARSGEIADSEHVWRLVRGLAREERLNEVVLGPLDNAARVALARSMAPGRDISSVVAAGEGNPLFTLEFARALASGGNAIPIRVEAALADHLSRPEGAARALLPWAAALGRAFDLALLTRCLTLSPTEWDNALEELERRGIIRCIGVDSYDFAHDLMRELAYGRVSQPRRRMLHGQIARSIAAAIDASEGGATLANELVRHAELGGNDALAARGCVLAGNDSLRLFANARAIDLALRGLRHLARMANGAERIALRIALLRLQILASPESRLRRWPRLLDELTEAVTAAEAAGLAAETATGYYLISVLHQDEGEAVEATEATLRAAAAGRQTDPATAVAQLANTARCLVELESNVGHARAMLAEARALVDRRHAGPIELFWAEALLKRWEGRLDTAVPLMVEALRLARDQGDRWRECKCLAWLAMISLELDEPEAALARCEELRPLAEQMGESGELPFVRALEALSRLSLGLPDAGPELGSAVDQLRAFDSKAHLAYVLNALGETAFESGRIEEALGAARDALAAAEATRRAWEAARARALLARILVARGDRVGAQRWLDPVLAGEDEGLSAHARSIVLLAARDLDPRIPTLDQTLSRDHG